MRWTSLLLLQLACQDKPTDDVVDDSVPVDDTDVADTVDTVPPAPVTATLTPAIAWGDEPLVCETTGATRVIWLRDGALWEGAVSTQPGAGVEGNVIAVADQRLSETWTCVAIGPDDQAVDTRFVRPANVVVLLADDLGYGDLALYGGPTATPRLEGLAAQGVRFSQAYAAAPLCGPSRAGLLTGRAPNRYGFEYNVADDPDLADRGLEPSEKTLGDLLAARGYDTAAIGKWHLGAGAVHHPNVRGFQKFWGFLNGRRPSLQPGLPGVIEYQMDEGEIRQWPRVPGGFYVELNGVEVTLDDRHLTDRIADEAADYVRHHTEAPFLLYVPFQATHFPIQATPDQLAAVPPVPGDDVSWAYRASVYALDNAIGHVLDAIDESGLAEHTLVVFASDNGCPEPGVMCSNGDLTGGKLQLTEGGIRVPMVVRWPQHVLAPGTVSDEVVSLLDVLPTALHAAGAPLPSTELDGVDLVPLLDGTATPPLHEALYWRILPDRAIRQGDVKVVDLLNHRWRFDLAADPGETVDLNADDHDGSMPYIDLLEQRGDDAYVPPAWVGRPATMSYYGTDVVAFY